MEKAHNGMMDEPSKRKPTAVTLEINAEAAQPGRSADGVKSLWVTVSYPEGERNGDQLATTAGEVTLGCTMDEGR